MKSVLVLGDGAVSPPRESAHDEVLQISTCGRRPNVRLQIDVFRTKFLREIPTRLDDLLRIAAYAYAADTRVSRGSPKDVYAQNWRRRFCMVIPVWEPTFWNSTNTKTLLTETLQFLTDDEYAFEFVERSTRSSDQGILHFKELPGSLPKVDLVVLFSGGTDSLAAVLEALSEGRHPILISHRSTPVIDSR